MENTNKLTSEATTATHNYKAPLWIGLHVEPCAARVLDSELLWLGVADQGFDIERAERLCQARKVYQVLFQRGDVQVQVDFEDGDTFKDWIACRRDELARDCPAFDTEDESRLAHEAVAALHKRFEEGNK